MGLPMDEADDYCNLNDNDVYNSDDDTFVNRDLVENDSDGMVGEECTHQVVRAEFERNRRVTDRQRRFGNSMIVHDESGKNVVKFILDKDENTGHALLEVDDKLVRHLKSHQIDGIQFMWNVCFESLKHIRSDKGSGCILAHAMGLGKFMILCPLNVVLNWIDEFDDWLHLADKTIDAEIYYLLGEEKLVTRQKKIDSWYQYGGVLILSYGNYQQLVRSQSHGREDIPDGSSMEAKLRNGPDVVVFDEGHVLKNETTKLSQSIKLIGTKRKILLSGTPVQNNLREYYNLVQHVKPFLLGQKHEFNNRFANFINNDQYSNSTGEDKELMKRQSYILHKILEGTVHRCNSSAVEIHLPPKYEYDIYVNLTPTQEKLYRDYLNKHSCQSTAPDSSIFTDHSILRLLWIHPRLFCEQLRKMKPGSIEHEWVFGPLPSVKLIVLMHIVQRSIKANDKVVVFSDSLDSIHEIGMLLNEGNIVYTYITGKTKAEDRRKRIKAFNHPENKSICVFLIIIGAGSLEINLIGANRIVLLDAGWNPSVDMQSVYRMYRLGQKKKCYIYRLICQGTMDEILHNRKIFKESISLRVIDQHQTNGCFTLNDLIGYHVDRCRGSARDTELQRHILAYDDVLRGVYEECGDKINNIILHGALFENMADEALDSAVLDAAWTSHQEELQAMLNKIDLA